MEHGSTARGASALAEDGEFRGFASGIIDEGGLDWGQFGQAGVVGAEVDRLEHVIQRARRIPREIIVDVDPIAPGVGPAVVPRLAHLVHGIEPARPAFLLVAARIGADVAHVNETRQGIDVEAPGVAEAHGVNLRPGLRGSDGEQIALRNGVAALRGGLDPEDLAAQIIGVG